MSLSTIVTITVVIVSGCLLGMKICFASKCDDVKLCWGMLTIHRNVVVEHAEIASNCTLGSEIRQMRNVANMNSEVVHNEMEDRL